MSKSKSPLAVAYEMGKRAFKKGIFDPPYKPQTVLAKEWQRGFDTAFLHNLKEALHYET